MYKTSLGLLAKKRKKSVNYGKNNRTVEKESSTLLRLYQGVGSPCGFSPGQSQTKCNQFRCASQTHTFLNLCT